jgi:deoxyribonuclease V
MDIPSLADWPRTLAQAKAVQQALAPAVERRNRLPESTRLVAGVDVGFEDAGRITRAAVAVLRFPELDRVEQAVFREATRFPYVPGYLSFRETPAILGALAQLATAPDVLLCDGQGLAHPRRFGLACHLGVLTGLPSIGVAKTRLVGHHAEVPAGRGACVALLDGDEVIGAVLRTRQAVQPLFVSIGHRIDLPTAVDFVLRCAPRYRLPETTRQAHRLASGEPTGQNR